MLRFSISIALLLATLLVCFPSIEAAATIVPTTPTISTTYEAQNPRLCYYWSNRAKQLYKMSADMEEMARTTSSLSSQVYYSNMAVEYRYQAGDASYKAAYYCN